MNRCFINQPAKSQSLWRYDRMNGLADLDSSENTVTFYFTSGDTTSMQVPKRTLSRGWVKNPQLEPDYSSEKATHYTETKKGDIQMYYCYRWVHFNDGTSKEVLHYKTFTGSWMPSGLKDIVGFEEKLIAID